MNENNNNQYNGFSVRLVQDSAEGNFLDEASLFSLLYWSYMAARCRKRNTPKQLEFEADVGKNLLELSRELHGRTWKPSPCTCFIITEPVKREVVAANFRDRVVHHLLCSWLFPIFERQFIYDSYSCRIGKGTLFGVNRVRKFVRAASDDFRRDAWILRLDIKGFFMHIDKEILYSLLMDGISRGRYAGVSDKSLCDYLVDMTVHNDPLENAIYNSSPDAWNDLPKDKSLKYSGDGKGLPIGNLTSQLYANVYLNPLDQFVKRALKVRWYGRYVDDMVLVDRDKEKLLECVGDIKEYLHKNLGLVLHPSKVQMQSAKYGFSFLGCYILPYRVYPGNRLRKKLNSVRDIADFNGICCHLNGTSCKKR